MQVEERVGTFAGYAFTGVPAAHRSWMAISASGGATSIRFARELADELRAVLLESSPQVAETAIPGVDPSGLALTDYPTRRKVLVLVAAMGEPFVDRAWYQNWQSDERDACVMTVVPPLAQPASFEDLLPAAIRKDDEHLLKRVNAAGWKTSIAEVVPAVLARADVTSGSARVFVSYRRHETGAVALALADRLLHAGFEVFLDQFSIPPGYDFQRRLGQELQDKSMVVLLDSEHVRDSKWTQHEIDFAKRHRLGLLSVRMPRVSRPMMPEHPALVLDETKDFDEAPEQVERSNTDPTKIDRWRTPKKETLDRLVAEIKKAHADALFVRRQRLRANLAAACTEAGLVTRGSSSGPLWVKGKHDEHMVWLTTRPAGVDDFQSLFLAHESWAARTAGSRGVIVGPQAALEPDRLARLRWLQRVTSCIAFDEGRLDDVVERLQSGTWS